MRLRTGMAAWLAAIGAAATLGVAGCESQGPFEETGEEVDETVDEIEDEADEEL